MAQQEGFVYILTNPSFKENWIKIGCTEKLPQARSKELSKTSVPYPFQVYASLQTSKYKEAEKLAHSWFDAYRITANREFFLIDPEKALNLFYSVAEFMGNGTIVNVYDENGTIAKTITYGTSSTSTNQSSTKSKKKRTAPPQIVTQQITPTDKHLFSVEGSGRYAKASGYYDETSRKFTILKGSIIAMEVTPTFDSFKARKKVLEVCDKISNGYCLKEDFTFASPSTAASVVLGRSENGNRVWKDADGKTLIEIYPKK